MTTVVAGLRATDNFGTDERPKNFREMILFRNPNGAAPLTALMAKLKTESTDDPEFAWWDEPNDIIRLQLNGLNATTDTDFAVDTGDPDASNPGRVWGQADHLVAGDLLQVESAQTTTYAPEIVMVSSVTNSTTFSVKRGQAGTTAATIPDDTWLTKIGNAFAEGSGAPNAASRNPTKYFNYCQIFKTVYDITNTTLETRFRTGDPLRNDKKRKMFDHARDLEMAYLWGVKSEGTGSNGKPIRTTGGLRSFIPADNTTIFTTTPTVDTILNAIYKVFDFDTAAGDERIAFLGNGAANAWNQIVKSAGNIEFGEVVRLYGMSLREYVLPQGRIFMRTHPLMNRHGLYKNSVFVIDPTALIDRPLRKTRFKDNIQANDEDRRKGQWLTESGLEVQYGGLTCAYIGNFTNP